MQNQQLTVGEIATLLSSLLGTEVPVHGPADRIVLNVRPLEEAGPSDLTFFAPTSKRVQGALLAAAERSAAAAILVPRMNPAIRATQLVVKSPFHALLHIARRLHPAPETAAGVDPTARVAESAELGEGVSIGAYAVVGRGVVVGAGTTIHPHVVIYDGAEIGPRSIVHAGAVIREYVRIGEDCVIQPGAVIGGDGFGYLPHPGKGHVRIPHVGTVVLEDGVDVGANSTVDRATFGETRVGEMAKLDNLVMVGHNCKVGARSLLCAMVGISGSSTIGKDVVLGGNAGVADHVTIRDGVRVGAKGGVTNSITEPGDYMGYPFRPAARWRREFAALARLPSVLRELRVLRRALVTNGLLTAEMRDETVDVGTPTLLAADSRDDPETAGLRGARKL